MEYSLLWRKRVCAHIHAFLSLSLRFKCIARVYMYIAREREKKTHTTGTFSVAVVSRRSQRQKSPLGAAISTKK